MTFIPFIFKSCVYGIDINSSIDAYNICYIKPEASQLIVTNDEDQSPILSVWQCGLGKVACYTGVLSDKLGGSFIKSKYASQILAGICNWIAFDDRNALNEINITQKLNNSIWKAYINLDPDRLRDPFTKNPTVELVTTSNDGKPYHYSLKSTWENADQLSVSYQVKGNEVLNSILKINDKLNLMLAPACQIYSPEFMPQSNRNGARDLKQIAKMTGGNELIDLNSVWATMPLVYQDKNVSNYLFTLALFLFLLEIAERRLALMSIILSFVKNIKLKNTNIKMVAEKKESDNKEPAIEGKTVEKTNSTVFSKEEIVAQNDDNKDKDKGFLGALHKAKKHADKRFQ